MAIFKNSKADLLNPVLDLYLVNYTTAERDALVEDESTAGHTIFNTTTNKINFWTGTQWEATLSA